MLIRRRRHQQSFRRKFVRFTVAIAAIDVLLIYFHSSIDAFSIGIRTLQTAYQNNNQVFEDPPPLAVIHTRKPHVPFSRIQTKTGDNDDDNAADGNTNSSVGGSPPPFFGETTDIYETIDENTGNSGIESSSPFFGDKASIFEIINDNAYKSASGGKKNPLEMIDTVADKSSIEMSSPFFGDRVNNFEIKDDDSENSGSDSPLSFFGEKYNVFEVKSDNAQKSKDSSFPSLNENKDAYQTNTSADTSKGGSSSSFIGENVDHFIEKESTFTSDSDDEFTSTFPGTPAPMLDRDEIETPSFQAYVDENVENSDKVTKAVPVAIAFVKSLPSKVEKTVINTQRLIKGIQDLSNQVNESVKKTKQTVKNAQELSRKVNQSIQTTKETIAKRQESAKEVVSKAKILFGVERPSLESRYERTVPMTPKDEALNFAGKATIASLKLSLWLGKEVSVLAWKGSRSVYENTIGPSVEENWIEQIDSVNRTIALVKNTPSIIKSSLTTSIQRGSTSTSISISEKIEPRNIEEHADLVSSGANAKNESAFVGRTEAKANGKNEGKANDQKTENDGVDSVVKSILNKSPAELSKEREDDKKLANEISDALDLANRALSNSDLPTDYKANLRKSNRLTWTRKVKSILKKPAKLNEEEKDDEKLEKEISDSLETTEQALSKANSKTEEQVNDYKDEEPKFLKTFEELNKEIEEAQKMAKELSNALDVAERALKINPNVKLDDPMIEIEKPKPIDSIEKKVLPSPSPSSVEKKMTRMERRRKRKTERIATRPRFKAAKTKQELDAELIEAQSLAKEIADALDLAEEALKVPANPDSDEEKIQSTTP